MATATAGPAQKVRSAGSTTSTTGAEHGYPHGHQGHLTEKEEKQFEAFKALLQEKGLYSPGPPPSHDDPTLLRYLRARRWIVQDAYQQFKDTEEWRKANQIDILYKTIDLDAYEMARRLYPQWTGRRDRRGIPLYVFEIRHLDSKAVHAYEKSAEETYSKAKTDGKVPKGLLRLFALYENLTRFTQPLSSQMPDREHPTTPITLSTNVVDVSGVSLKQFWNLKSHMQAASVLATAHYPETLDRIFVIGAPAFFTTVWGWIKRWFDPNTVSKIFILSANEVKPTLTQYIDPKNIPKKYGGELDFNWGDRPVLDPHVDEVVEWEDGFNDFPAGPIFWRDMEDGRLECVAVGSVNKVERMQRVCTIRKNCPTHPMPEGTVGEKTQIATDISEPTEGGKTSEHAPSVEETSKELTGPVISGKAATKDGNADLSEKVTAEPILAQRQAIAA